MGKVFVLGSKETVLGFRLAGVRGEVVGDRESTLRVLQRILSSDSYKLLIISEGVANLIRQEIEEIKGKELYPLIVEVPERGGWRERSYDYLERMIREALGIDLKG